MKAAQLVNLLGAGLLTGNELGTWGVVHPAVERLPFRVEVAAEREITRRYGYVMPGLISVTIASGVRAADTASGVRERRLLLAATFSYAVMLAITLLGNVPLNAQTLRFAEADGEDEWRRIRGRWDRLHAVRVALDTAGFTCAALAALGGGAAARRGQRRCRHEPLWRGGRRG